MGNILLVEVKVGRKDPAFSLWSGSYMFKVHIYIFCICWTLNLICTLPSKNALTEICMCPLSVLSAVSGVKLKITGLHESKSNLLRCYLPVPSKKPHHILILLDSLFFQIMLLLSHASF